MSTYQVFVERPSSAAPDALSRLAAAMAERYGIARADLEPRLRAGRFRVKNNVDLATAEKFADDLEKLGAVVSVVGADDVAITRAKSLPAAAPVAKPAAPRPEPRPSQQPYHVGLAAALDARGNEPDLGALGETSSSFALSALDGSDENAAVSGSFTPPAASAEALPASIGPAIAPPARAPRVTSASEPIDMFAPPESENEAVDLAVDLADVKAKRASVASTPPPIVTNAAPAQPARGRTTAQPPIAEMPVAPAAAPATSGLGDTLRAFAGHERARLAVGAGLAVLIGFAPAAILSVVRERSAYAEIDRGLAEKSAEVRSVEQWKSLDQFREAARDEKLAEKHSIALTAVLVWAAVSSGFAFVWFRKIDWDRVAA